MIRQALDTLPNCLPSSKTPTLVLITLSAVVISPRFLPAATAALRTYEDFITIVRFSLSTYSLWNSPRSIQNQSLVGERNVVELSAKLFPGLPARAIQLCVDSARQGIVIDPLQCRSL